MNMYSDIRRLTNQAEADGYLDGLMTAKELVWELRLAHKITLEAWREVETALDEAIAKFKEETNG